MSFALRMRSVPLAPHYATALSIFNRAVPWRDGGDDRPLPNKRTHIMGVRMDGDDVVFRYHHTDVVRWRLDGSYTIDTGGYSSRSTCEFATHFMPLRHALMSEARHLRVDNTIYPMFGNQATVSADGVVSGPGVGRFEESTVIRKRAEAMLTELGYYEYLTWHKAMYPMVRDNMPPSSKRKFAGESEVVGALRVGQDAYHELMMMSCGDPNEVRDLLYRYLGYTHRIWDVTYHDTLPISTNLRRYNIVMREA